MFVIKLDLSHVCAEIIKQDAKHQENQSIIAYLHEDCSQTGLQHIIKIKTIIV